MKFNDLIIENVINSEIPKDILILFKGGKSAKYNYDIKVIAEKFGYDLKELKTQLKLGMKIESEHSNNKIIQKIISLDHLTESLDYYKELELMERKLK